MANVLTYIYGICNSYIKLSKEIATEAAFTVLFSGLLLFAALNAAFAQQSSQQAAPRVQKSLEDLEEYGRLEEKIKSGEKTYIKDIVVNGVTLLSRDKVKALVEPYLRHWLTRKDIQQLIDSLKEFYQKTSQYPPEVSYRIEGYKLIIVVEE